MDLEKMAKAALALTALFTLFWFVGAWAMPSIFPPVNFIPIVGVFVAAFLAPILAPGFIRSTREPGGMKGEISVWLIIIVVALAMFAGIGVYSMFGGAKAAQSVAQVPPPSPGTPADTFTYQVRGLAQAGTVQPVQYPAIALADQAYTVDAVDFDQGSAVTSLTVVNLTDSVSGVPYQPSTLGAGKVVTSLVTKSGYIGDVVTMRAGQKDAPAAHAKLKAFDTSASLVVYNAGGHTLNAVTSAATRQSLTASSGTTVSVEITPSAKNKRIAGGDNNQFAVLINASNATSVWVGSSFAVSTAGGFVNSVSGSPLALAQQPTGLGGNYITGFAVPADFKGTDTGIYKLDLTLYPSASYVDVNATITVCITSMEYYQQVNAQTGIAKGSLHVGPVKDDGSAIQTPKCKDIFIGNGI